MAIEPGNTMQYAIDVGNGMRYAPEAVLFMVAQLIIFCDVPLWFVAARKRNAKDAKSYEAEKRATTEFWEGINRPHRDRIARECLDDHERGARPMGEACAEYPWLAEHIGRLKAGKRKTFGQ